MSISGHEYSLAPPLIWRRIEPKKKHPTHLTKSVDGLLKDIVAGSGVGTSGTAKFVKNRGQIRVFVGRGGEKDPTTEVNVKDFSY